MAKIETEKKKAPSAKKQAYEQIITQLTSSLPALKDLLGEKKFQSRVKKAAKLLSAGIKAKKVKTKKEPVPQQA